MASACIGGTIAAMLLSGLLADQGRGGLVTAVALVLLAGLPLLSRLREDRLDAPGLYGVISVAFLGLTSLAWLGTPGAAGPGLVTADITRALHVVAIGLGVFAVGASLTGRLRSPRRTVALAPDRVLSTKAFVSAYFVGAGATAVALLTGAYGYVSSAAASGQAHVVTGVVGLVGNLGGLTILAFALTCFATRRRGVPPVLWILITIQMALGFMSGNKAGVLEAPIFLLLAFIAIRRTIPWAAMGVATLFTLVVVVPANQIYRDAVRVRGETPTTALQWSTSALRSDRPSRVNAAPLSPTSYVLERFRPIDSVALIVSNTPSTYPYAGGDHYLALPLLLTVPRLLWPTKPALDEGATFSNSYWQAPSNVKTSTGLTQIGDLYRNFTLLGVAVGMFLWGAALGYLSRVSRHMTSPRALMVYIYAIPYVVLAIENDLPSVLQTAGRTIPLAVLVAWLLLPGINSEPGYRRLGSAEVEDRHAYSPQSPTSRTSGATP